MPSSSSSTGQTALNARASYLCRAAAYYFLGAAYSRGKQNQPPASVPADSFFLCLGCHKQWHLQFQKGSASLPRAPGSSATLLWQSCAHPARVPAKAGEVSVHPSAQADGGAGWACPGIWGGWQCAVSEAAWPSAARSFSGGGAPPSSLC